MVRMALPIIRRMDSPIPIGRTPGHLSIAIRRQATKADNPLGATYEVHNLLARAATDSHRPAQWFLNDERRRFQPAASIPEGPAAPLDLRATLWIKEPSS